MEFLTTKRGNVCALYDGYSYRKFMQNKDGVVMWRCMKEKSHKCRGKLFSKETEVIRVVEHQCVPDEAKLDVTRARCAAKKRSREEDSTPIRQIYSEEFERLVNTGYELVTKLPLFSNIRSSLYKTRAAAQGLKKEPESAQEIELSEETLCMSDGQNFLLADTKDEDRVLIFASLKGKEILKEKSDFFMDGTFKSSSKQFLQLYTLHADLGSTDDQTNIVPVLFALLPNKKTETYKKLFRKIREEIPQWKPNHITIDYEAAAIAAVKQVFPEVHLHGCFFHMSQCLWRKVQEIGLTTDYKTNEEVRKIVRMCGALSFLKIDDIDEGWMYIHGIAPTNDKVTQFLDYFVDQWLDNRAVPKAMWNCYNRRHRTTNCVEGWHSKLNRKMGRTNPRIKQLVKILKEEAECASLSIIRQELNLEGVKRKKKYCKLDNRIKNCTMRYEEDGNVGQLLEILSYVLKLD